MQALGMETQPMALLLSLKQGLKQNHAVTISGLVVK